MSFAKQLFVGFKAGFGKFGHNLSLIVNSLLLSVVYLLGVGSSSIIAKIFGKHFLNLKVDKKKDSYWSELDLKNKPIEEYYRQF